MKRSLFVISILICSFINLYSQTSTDSLAIRTKLKDEYVVGDTINFYYINNSNKSLYVHISLERLNIDGEWEPYFDEIYISHEFSNFDNVVLIHFDGHISLSEFSSKAIKNKRSDTWAIKKDCLYKDETIAMFRFKYTISEIPHGLVFKETGKAPEETICYSDSFYIKNNISANKNDIQKNKNKYVLMKP